MGVGGPRRLQCRHHRHLLPQPGVAGSRRPHRRLLPHQPCPGERSRAARRGVASALQVPGPAGLERRHLERDRLHGLRAATSSTRSPRRRTSITPASRPAARLAGYRPTRTHAWSRTIPTISRATTRSICRSDTAPADRPANEYLRNISVQLVVQNITDKTAPYEYKITTGGGFPCACDVFKSLFGRMISVRLQKTF